MLLDADLRDDCREEQWDVVNEWEVVSTTLKYDMEKGKEHHSPFKIKKFSNSNTQPRIQQHEHCINKEQINDKYRIFLFTCFGAMFAAFLRVLFEPRDALFTR